MFIRIELFFSGNYLDNNNFNARLGRDWAICNSSQVTTCSTRDQLQCFGIVSLTYKVKKFSPLYYQPG